MAYIKRDLEPKILLLSREYSAILITGPRQVGKTTVLRQLMHKNRTYVTLDDLEDRSMAQNDPALFLQLHSRPVLIDEVQYAPQLFSYIKIEIDNGAEPGSFWLTGSQAFHMMELAQESLAGRAALLHMPSLSQHYRTRTEIRSWEASSRRTRRFLCGLSRARNRRSTS